MKYYMPHVIIDWKVFDGGIPFGDDDPRVGIKFVPVYTSREQCEKYNPGIGIVEIEHVDSPELTVIAPDEKVEESK